MKTRSILTVILLLTIGNLWAKTIRVLAVGNSFSEDAVEQYLYELCAEGDDTLIIGNAYRGGQGLESHWNVVTNRQPAFSYRKIVEGIKTTTEACTLDAILADEPWDIVTFQQVSQDAGRPDTYEPYETHLIGYAQSRLGAKQLRIGFHMTWAYPEHSTHSGFKHYRNSQAEMYRAIVGAVRTNMKRHRDITLLIPSGTAIQNARATYLGDRLNRDGFHLSLGLGRYISACTWAEAITRKTCIGRRFRPENVSARDVLTAQKAAHSAIKHPYRLSNLSIK